MWRRPPADDGNAAMATGDGCGCGGGGGRGGPMSFGKSKAKLLGEDQIKTTFDRIANARRAIQLQAIRD